MRAAPQQHVDVQLPGGYQQAVCVAGRDDGVAMGEAYAQGAMCDDLAEREVRCVDVEVALHDLQVRRNGAQPLVRLLRGDVAQAEDLAYLARREELLELCACLGRVRRGSGAEAWIVKRVR